MRKARLWLASALAASLVLGSIASGEPEGKQGGKFGDKKGVQFEGKKGAGKKGGNKGGPDSRAFQDRGPGGPGGSIERALDELKLTDKKKEKAEEIVKAHHETVRKLTELARSELLLKMKDVVSADELKTFTTALERRPGGPGDGFRGGPGAGGRGRGGPGGRGAVSVDAVVERIMSFDKNKDGKITKDELPERMQRLMEMGDTNKDGLLDRDEIKALAAKLEKEGFGALAGPGGFGGRGGRGPGGFGGFAGPGGPGGPAGSAERALDELKLTDKKKEKAEGLVKAYAENVRKLMDLARSDLLVKMKDVLSADELKTFTTALERRPEGPRGGFGGPGGPRGGPGGPGGRGRGPGAGDRPAPGASDSKTSELEKKLEKIQKELEELRKAIKP
jgi:hypothetical protein